MILNLYDELIASCNLCSNVKLLRDVYFLTSSHKDYQHT